MSSGPVADQAEATWKEIDANLRQLFRIIDGFLESVPGFLSDLVAPIQTGLSRLSEAIRSSNEKLERFWTVRGNEDALRELASRWDIAITSPLSNLRERLDINKLKANIDWRGRAAEEYKSTVPAQGKKLEQLGAFTAQVSESLRSLANAIETFWTQIWAGLTTFAGSLALAIASIPTPLAIPGVLVGLGSAAVALGDLVQQVYTQANSQVEEIESGQRAIQGKLASLGAEWASTDFTKMDDASVSDGNTDWHVQT